jgi:hypothetical protein
MSTKPIAERIDALNALIESLLEWQEEFTKGQPQLDTMRLVNAAWVFMGFKNI